MEDYKEKTKEIELQLEDSKLPITDRLRLIVDIQKFYMFIDFDKAIEYSKLGMSLSKKHMNECTYHSSLGNLGVCYYNVQKFDKALNCLNKLKDYFIKIEDKDRLYTCLISIATIFMDTHDYTNAIDLYLSIIKELKTDPKEIRQRIATMSMINLNRCYQNTFQLEKSEKLLNEINLYINNHKLEDSTYLKGDYFLGKAIYSKLKGDFNQSIIFVNQSIELYLTCQAETFIVDCYYVLVECYESINNDADLLETCNKAIELSFKCNYTRLNHFFYRELYQYFLKKNDYKNSIAYFEKYHLEIVKMDNNKIQDNTLSTTEATFANFIKLNGKKANNNIKNIFESTYSILVELYDKSLEKINLSHIVYVKYENDLTTIYTHNGDNHKTNHSFEKLANMIDEAKTDDFIFFKLYDRTCLVNLFWVSNYNFRNRTVTISLNGQKLTLDMAFTNARKLKDLIKPKK